MSRDVDKLPVLGRIICEKIWIFSYFQPNKKQNKIKQIQRQGRKVMTTNRKLFCCMYQRPKYRTFMKCYDLVTKLSVKTKYK